MKKIQLLVLFLSFLQVPCKLDTLEESYVDIISHINNYYKCDFIFLFGDTANTSNRQWNQQVNLAKYNIRLKNLEKFKKAAKPLVVFFKNPDSTKFQLITSAIDASKPIFCFFMNMNAKVEDFFSNIYFPYRYKFIVSQRNEMDSTREIIWKVKLDNKKKQIVKLLFATWSEETGIKSFTRPKDILSGHTVRAGIRHNPPFSYVRRVNNELQLTGYAGKLAKILESLLNFRFTYTLVSEVGIKENGTWSGGLGLLLNDSIDMFFSLLIITLERNDYFDFSLPLFKTNLDMFLKKTDNAFSWSSYFEPFNITVWYIIVLTIIIESVALTVFEYYKKIDVIRRLRRKPIKIPIQCTQSFLRVYGAMCNQSLSPSNFNSLRILQLTIHVTALFILTFYSAIFLSIITAPQFKRPITSFKDLIEDGRYKVGCVRGESWNIFKKSKNEAMQKIFHKYVKTQNPIPTSHDEGLKRMCKDDKYAFITYDNLASFYSSPSCTQIFIENLSKVLQGMAFPHNSQYTKIFNKLLLKMHESGILKKINHESFSSSKKIEESWTPINGFEVLPIILFLIGFMLFSIILLLSEIFVHRRISQRRVQFMSYQRALKKEHRNHSYKTKQRLPDN